MNDTPPPELKAGIEHLREEVKKVVFKQFPLGDELLPAFTHVLYDHVDKVNNELEDFFHTDSAKNFFEKTLTEKMGRSPTNSEMKSAQVSLLLEMQLTYAAEFLEIAARTLIIQPMAKTYVPLYLASNDPTHRQRVLKTAQEQIDSTQEMFLKHVSSDLKNSSEHIKDLLESAAKGGF